ncbi:mannose-1-phosphate guanyltransferase beta [Anaeramoeba ignava]|uniref:mannose-1-phosphate guanylyltransferase n=1 Tax=Anaeramoeba ignava TaxID=1746090 RepID=A0A9Q0LMJ6_ANAIG|nr:mannose-1-phosphate guanyltransferase beta [Anaeramoeba ignava]
MKALILVGGYGTRLRPLTLTKPKPLVEFANKPIIRHQIEALVSTGVTEIVLALSYQAEAMKNYMKVLSEELKVKITFTYETQPLGTAGPLALARDILWEKDTDPNTPMFMLNSDVICEFPLKEMLEFHKNHKKQGTILVTQVQDPSKYGVIVHEDSGKIQKFVEKPKIFVGNEINAGIYILNINTIDRIQLKPTSIEREVFPLMAKEEELFCFPLKKFWMDMGQPADYIRGLELYLNFAQPPKPEKYQNVDIVGNVVIDDSVEIGDGSVIGPNVSVDKNVKIGKGVRLANCAVFSGSVIDNSSFLSSSLIGWNCHIGSWTRLENGCVLGDDVTVKNEVFMNNVIVLPNKVISESIPQPKIIL